ncbi:MAG: PH domain-containing protein [Arenimonas sp.]
MIDLHADDVVVAKFNALIRPYMVLQIGLVMVMSIAGIPLALFWFLGVGQWWARHYFDKLHCEISDIEIRFRKGILFQVEKTIPLENIQDVTFIEGPLLKYFHLSILKFETAGQSAHQAHDMQFVGIIDAHDFRQLILTRRQAVRSRMQPHKAAANSGANDEQLVVLNAIKGQLDEITALLKNKE